MKKILVLIISAVMALGVVGCGRLEPSVVDETKTQIYIDAFNGGHGTKWISDLATEFMKDNPYDANYQIIVTPTVRNEPDIMAELKTGKSKINAVITSFNAFTTGIYQDLFEDITDVANSKVDGVGKGSILDKLIGPDEWKSIYSKNGAGLYAIPFADSMAGLAYDHKLFDENNWYNYATDSDADALAQQGIVYEKQGSFLIYKSSSKKNNYTNGDHILSKGKDGKFGTYDDGQAIDEAQWKAMLDRIVASGAKPFIWSGAIDAYVNSVTEAAFAQYAGIDEYNTYFNYDSGGNKVALHSGENVVITLENGHRVNEMESVYKMYEFANNYLNASDTAASKKYIHNMATDISQNHTDAQNNFLLGYKGAATNPQGAMLVDGSWWESEAKNMFNTLGKSDVSRGYGVRDYRYMLLPNFEGQKSEKTVFASMESGTMLITKDANKERLKVTKEFLAYLVSDNSLRYFARETGAFMPYKHDLTETDLAALTPLGRNVYELYYDSENIQIIKPNLSSLLSPMAYASSKGTTRLSPKIGTIQTLAVRTVRDYSMKQIADGLKGLYSKSEWDGFIAQAKAQGFYA